MWWLGTGAWDQRLLALGYAGGQPIPMMVAQAVTTLGNGAVLIMLTLIGSLTLLWRGKTRPGLVLLSGTLMVRALVEAQKLVTNRARPIEHPALDAVTSLSFPSGHAANSMLLLLALALLLARGRSRPWWIAAALALSVAIGVSRIMLGVHWPSDVVAGWAFGCAGAVLLAHLARQHTTSLQTGSR